MKGLATAIGVTESLLIAFFFAVAGVSGVTLGLLLVSATAVGWLLAARVPRNLLGWLLLFVSGCFLLYPPASFLAPRLVESAPGVAAWLVWVSGSGDWAWIWLPPVGVLFTQVLLRFPDGRLPTRRWRNFSAFTIATVAVASLGLATAPADFGHGLANPIGARWLEQQSGWVFPMLGGLLLVSFVGSVASLVVRFRGADEVVREQIRWFAWAAAVVVSIYVLSFVIPGDWTSQVVSASYALIPAAIGIAVLRYRLFDIDRIISRTVSYAVVTGAVLLTYAMVVTALTALMPGSSALAVSAATLAAAAILRPVLRWTRNLVDRRFNRDRYDGARTVEEFGERMSEDVEVESVLASLVQTVHATVQPTTVTVWQPQD